MKPFQLLAGTLSAAAALMSVPSDAQADDVGWSVGLDYVTDYVFRGASLGADSIQPYVEISSGGFTGGIWASTGVGEGSQAAADEIDFYGGYSVPLDGSISLDLGVTYYHYPQSGDLLETEDGAAGSYEVSAALGFGDVMFAPSVAAYYDFTLENFTLEGAIGHKTGFDEKNAVDFGLTVGLVDGDGTSYEWATATAALSHAITEAASVYVGANYTVNSENALDFNALNRRDELLWFGTGISTRF
ncbi:TorF family putative porin [uncultured Algimonas sp.]|uniref:TorF family putative porin n=1 Tax=uncultured Algimonas sp. TaxID=1547920 RepID=UPI00260D4FD9|nr:TorF family putative porin [uncultured Algimonas sp.]